MSKVNFTLLCLAWAWMIIPLLANNDEKIKNWKQSLFCFLIGGPVFWLVGLLVLIGGIIIFIIGLFQELFLWVLEKLK